MSIEAGKTYKLVNVAGGTVVDLSGVDNKAIIGYSDHNGPNQQWLLEHSGASWTFKNVAAGTYLGVEQQNPGDGTPLVALGSPFVWDIWPDEQDSTTYRIFVPNTIQNVDLSGHGSSTPGTPVIVWSKWNGKNQTWRFVQTGM